MILRTTELLALIGVSRMTLWRWLKAGTFPQPIKLGTRAVGWRKAEVEEWVRNLSRKTA